MPFKTSLQSAKAWSCVISAAVIAIGVAGCKSNPLAGNWDGVVKLNAGATPKKGIGYSETKQSLKSNLYLDTDGSYKAKLQEVTYTGDWSQSGQTITLKPKTFMGMDRATFPATKSPTAGSDLDKIFKSYTLDLSTDSKTMTHTDDNATTTFTHAASS